MTATPAHAGLGTRFRSVFSLSGATGPLIGLLLLCLFLSLATDSFLSFRNFLNIADQVTVLALTMMVMGYLNVEAGLPLPVAIAGGLAAAVVCGAASGLVITAFRVPAFIATLAMMSIARGLASMITDGSQIIGFPAWFNMAAIIRYGGVLTLTVAVMLVVFALAFLVLRYRREGRILYAIGGNPEVARLAGINVNRATVVVYMVSAFLSGLAGVLLAARLDSVQPSSGVGYELDAIAAVVIGGTSLSGGTGGIVGTLIGVLIIGVLRNGLNLLSVSPFLQAVIIGAVILLAVAAETFKHRRR